MRPRGVTLLELVCALAVMLLLLAAAVNVIAPLARAGRLRAGASGVAATLRSARALALACGQAYAVRFDTASDPDRLLVYGSLGPLPDASWDEARWRADARYAGVSARLPSGCCVVPKGGSEGDAIAPVWFRPDGSAGPPGGAFAYEVRGAGDESRPVTVLETTGLVLQED